MIDEYVRSMNINKLEIETSTYLLLQRYIYVKYLTARWMDMYETVTYFHSYYYYCSVVLVFRIYV